MARLYPEEVSPDAPAGERRVIEALAELPDPWRVFHRVAWQGERDGRESDGEADVVLLHPSHGLLVLEVKGGGVLLERGTWYSLDGESRRHRVANPFEQATSSKHALLDYLRGSRARLPFIPVGHGVVFPDVVSPGPFGPAGPPELVIDSRDLRDPEGAIHGLVRHWEPEAQLSPAHVDAITALLAPTVAIQPVLREAVADARARLIYLTDQQMRVLDGLRRNRRAMIYGAAGTGKTVMAAERARRLAVSGFRVLLTCFNRPLADHLVTEIGRRDKLLVHSFHSLCIWQVSRAGMEVPSDPSPRWWDEELPELLPLAAEANDFSVEAIVVDEGQDFAPFWFTALQMLLGDPDSGPFYVFADPHQAIYREGWEAPFDQPAFDLSVNCRNTIPIARRVASIYADEMGDVLGVSGPEPEFVLAEGVPIAVLRGVLQRLLHEEELRADQIVVLADHKETVEALRGTDMAGQRLVEAGQSGVVVETIHRFKGLEADCVVLILSDVAGERGRALAYVGMSRPRAHLVVIGPSGVRNGLTWGEEGEAG